jgi:hypothetical protein
VAIAVDRFFIRDFVVFYKEVSQRILVARIAFFCFIGNDLLWSVPERTNQKQTVNYFRREKKMKCARFAILSGVLASILVIGCALAAAPPTTVVPSKKQQGQWKVVIPQTLFADKMRMAAFLNETFGIMGGAGDPGKARVTSDGGKTWTVADSSGG